MKDFVSIVLYFVVYIVIFMTSVNMTKYLSKSVTFSPISDNQECADNVWQAHSYFYVASQKQASRPMILFRFLNSVRNSYYNYCFERIKIIMRI
jgi:hypothetical protein